MRKALFWCVDLVWKNLGECGRCIRKAFHVAAAAWVLTIILKVFDEFAFSQALLFVASALTLLWLAHMLVHARKVTIMAKKEDVASGGDDVSRRALFPLFAKTLFATVLLSATPSFAQSFPCTNGTGSCEQDNCPRCTRPCYGPGGCIKCRSCGADCGEPTYVC